MAKNGQASWGKTQNFVNLTHMPTPKTEYVVDFEKLIGGLNLYDPDYRLKLNESPDMENMLWKNGTLCSRYGQTLATPDDVDIGRGYTCFNELYWEHAFFHIGYSIYYSKPSDEMTLINLLNPTDLVPGQNLSNYWHGRTGEVFVPQRGTFLRYGEDLFYKAPGVFLKVHYGEVEGKMSGDGATTEFTIPVGNLLSVVGITVGGVVATGWTVDGHTLTFETAPASGTNNIVATCMAFTVTDIGSKAGAYAPITYVNASWRNGSGDSYQPENRLSSVKTIWYNPGLDSTSTTYSGTGSQTSFALPADFVYADNVTVNGAAYGNYIISGGNLVFYTAPASGTNNIVLSYQKIVKTYKLPVTGASIEKVVVDGNELALTTGYTFADDMVTLVNYPNHDYPMSTNTVRITYSLNNDDAYHSIMDCPYAIVYGGAQNICMVVGGCRAQPNAFFWNGNNIAMDVSYWPMEQYNLGGDTEDEITGFGRQQGYLVVFKKNSVGKGELQFTTVDPSSDTTARTYIEIDYTNINSMTGCDLPWSIQLIENNLVFTNTKQGVHIVLDSSAAYENNIVTISRKVNGDLGRVGLLKRVRDAENVSSFDDNKRYWIIMDGHVFCWDYELSTYKDPSWFYLTNINASALFMDVATIYHLGYTGGVTVFNDSYSDYGNDYERRYQFATQYFRSYDRMKTVTNAIFTFRPDTDFNVRVTYRTDWEERDDLTPIKCYSWRLVPRYLVRRALNVVPFAFVVRRRPGCRHVRHFAVILRCTDQFCDMPLLSAQVFYKYEGRDRGTLDVYSTD